MSNTALEALRRLFGASGSPVADEAAARPRGARRRLEASRVGRRSDWRGSPGSPMADLARLDLVRARSRDLARNNSYAAGIVEALVSNLVGDGAVPRCSTGSAALDARVRELWDRWAPDADSTGALDFYGLQALAVQSWLESGEVFVRARPRRASDGLAVPLQLQLLEADYCPADEHRDFDTGARIVAGVEFSPTERRTYFHLYQRHPGDTWASVSSIGRDATLSRVPAEDVAHLYRPVRPGQVRGLPWLTPAIMRLRMLDDYTEAELERKRIEACFSVLVMHDDDDASVEALTGATDAAGDEDDETPLTTNGEGEYYERIAPGMIAHAWGGKDVKTLAPASVGGYDAYILAELHGVCAGVGVPFHVATGNLDRASYSSARIGGIEFNRLCIRLQNTVIVPLLLDRVWRWFVDAAVAAGELPAGAYSVRWLFPRKEAYEREREVAADVAELRAGLATYDEILARRFGEVPADVLAAQKAALAAADEAGLVLDWDARRTDQAGSASGQEAAGPSPVQEVA